MNFKHTRQKIKDAVNRIEKNDKVLKRIGNAVKRNVVADSLNGKSFDGRSFPSLKPSSIKYRKYIAKYNSTSKDYSPATSNVSLIGDLLKNIKTYIEHGKITIEARGTHKAYKGKKGKHKHRATYSTILNALYDLNRRIMGLSKRSKQKVILEVKREIRRGLK